MEMKIEAHLLCWNEKDIMPFVLRHYQSFCDKIVIHDNHSTDGSAEWALLEGCEVIPFGDKFFNDQHNMDVKNSCWKGSDADWVIVADFDECLFSDSSHPIRDFLSIQAYHGATIINTKGWQIMSDEWPVDQLTSISTGYEFKNYAKNIVFNPKALREINYGPGAHECNPAGDVSWSHGIEIEVDEGYLYPNYLYVLHYKHIGGVERTINRYREYSKRMSKINRQQGWGSHYAQSASKLRREWNERMEKSKNLF